MSTRALAEFAAAISFESLPSEVIGKAKTSIRDFLGVALYVSRNTPWGKTIAEYKREKRSIADSMALDWLEYFVRKTPAIQGLRPTQQVEQKSGR